MASPVPVIELDNDEGKEKPIITLDDLDEVPVVTLEDDVATEPLLISLDDDKAQNDFIIIEDDRNIEDSSERDIICDSALKHSKDEVHVINSDQVITLDDCDHFVPENVSLQCVPETEETLPSTSGAEDMEIDVIVSSNTSKTNKALLECKKCHKMFSHIHKLNIHPCITNRKQFQCSTCNEIFFDKNELSKHTKAHSGGKPYICDICFKNFSDRNILRMHYNTHTGEKPFACTICDKVFPNTLALKNHYQMHIGEKPYVCDVCLTSFDHKSSLCNHKLKEHQFLTVI